MLVVKQHCTNVMTQTSTKLSINNLAVYVYGCDTYLCYYFTQWYRARKFLTSKIIAYKVYKMKA